MKITLLKLFPVLCTLLILLASCGNTSATELKFSFSTSVPSESNDEKTIFINKDITKLELDSKLTIDTGSVTVEIINASNEETVWSGKYNKDTSFKIELNDLKAESEFVIKVHASQAKKVTITLTSNEKLVRNKETPDKPDKYIVG